MTQKENEVYNLILKFQPICDLCLSEKLGPGYNQYANTICRGLAKASFILRTKGKCTFCSRRVLLNSILAS